MIAPAAARVDREALIAARARLLLDALPRADAGQGDPLRGFLQRLMAEEDFRIRALRFVDVLPALGDDRSLLAHFHEYFAADALPLPGLVRGLVAHAQGPLAARLAAPAIRQAVRFIAMRYLGGATIGEALKTAQRLQEAGHAVTLSPLGEAVLSDPEAGAWLATLDASIDACAERRIACDLAVKPSALAPQARVTGAEGTARVIAGRLRPLLHRARAAGLSLTLDTEHYEWREATLRAFMALLDLPECAGWSGLGLAVQAYLTDAESVVESLVDRARGRSAPFTVRLVRGAYHDRETILAHAHGWPVPVWQDKGATDACYERCLERLFAAHPALRIAVATHNARSLAAAIALAEEYGLTPDDYEFQMLYGMSGPLDGALRALGHRVRSYLPWGELVPGMAYLVRRLIENSQSLSFARFSGAGSLSMADFAAPQPHALSEPVPGSGFINTSARRFTDPAERARFDEALSAVRASFGRTYPLWIGAHRVHAKTTIASVNPAAPEEVVGRVATADTEAVESAVAAARVAFGDWSARSFAERAASLRHAAQVLGARRDEFAALLVFEAGKIREEADAEVVEAIDFLRYYADEAERLGAPRQADVPGEINRWHYRPRGVGVVLPPWNFPLAILTGMLSAALVTGNSLIVKPSSQTPVVAAWLVELLIGSGVPEGAVNFLPGAGDTVGHALAAHPGIHFIAFTGSLETGGALYRLAAEPAPGQRHMKRIVAEMGGKNAIIVDADADPDEAIAAVLASAFGYQGQKCSACSRVVTVGADCERLVERLIEATASLVIGPPERPDVALGPVISAAQRDRIEGAIAAGRTQGAVRLRRSVSGLNGYYVGPAIFDHVPADAPLVQEEIFGPVLAIQRAADLDEAFRLANGTRYALTGGFFSRSPSAIERAMREFEVGNLYINRKITGALVGRQPFGGFRMSGLGAKAGGPDYLLQFLDARTMTENTLRKGFAPR